MKQKVILGPHPIDDRKLEYPCWNVWSEDDKKIIVLFFSNRTGTCVYQHGTNSCVGVMNKDWDEHKFEPFFGCLTIQRD